MKGNSLSVEQLEGASGGADIILSDGQQQKIKNELERLRGENKGLKERTARAEVLNDIYETNKVAKKSSTMMQQIGKDTGVI